MQKKRWPAVLGHKEPVDYERSLIRHISEPDGALSPLPPGVSCLPLIILGKIGTATEAPSKIDPAYIDRRGIPAYQSEVKIAVSRRLSSDNDASDRELCNWLDEKGEAELPSSWAKRGNRSFADAYADNTVKVKMESRFSEVRRDMRKAGYRIP